MTSFNIPKHSVTRRLGLLLLLALVGQPFTATAATYFVNDTNTVNDLWCSAIGDDLNDGLTAATPKATVQSVIDTYDLDGGDQVRIDTGTYVLTNDITVALADSGVATALVSFVASPYGVTIDRFRHPPRGPRHHRHPRTRRRHHD